MAKNPYGYPEFIKSTGYGTGAGLKGWNCYHDFHPFIPGISTPTYTAEEVERMNAEEAVRRKFGDKEYTAYEATQRQRELERVMRKYGEESHLLELGGADEDTVLATKVRYQTASQEYAAFSKAMGLPQQRERIRNGMESLAKYAQTDQEALDISGKSGIITKEESPRKSKTGSFDVDWGIVQSPEYSEKFKKLSDNPTVSEAIETRAIWALNNRSGTQTEEIYAVSLISGKEIARITNQNHDSGVERSHSFDKKLSVADSNGDNILLIHNHPRGLPPSISDINELLKHKNVSGITVGHNGSVYRYTRPNSKIPEIDWNVEMLHFSEFSELTSMEKSLEVLMEKFGFEFEML